MREGSYEGRVKAEDAPLSTPDIKGMVDVTGFKVKVFGAIKAVELDGKAVDFTVCEECGYSKEDHEKAELTFKITK